MYARPLVLALLATALFIGSAASGQSTDGGGASDLAAIVAGGADTPAGHQALAQYYADKAADARATARNHRIMAKQYGGKATALDTTQAKHCARIVELSDQAAATYDEMAKVHSAAAAGK